MRINRRQALASLVGVFLWPNREISKIGKLGNLRIPNKIIYGDYVSVPTYDIGASIDWVLKYERDAQWNIVGDAMNVLEKELNAP